MVPNLCANFRFHAQVNIGAERVRDLKIESIEHVNFAKKGGIK